MNRGCTSRREGGRKEWVLRRSRQGSGRGQTVIIVEDDGRELLITKTYLYHQFTTTFPFPPPSTLRPASSANNTRPYGPLRLTLGDVSATLQALFQMRGRQLRPGPNKRSPLEDRSRSSTGSKRTNHRALTERFHLLITSLVVKEKLWMVVKIAGEISSQHTNHLRVRYPCRFVKLAEVRLFGPCLTLLSLRERSVSERECMLTGVYFHLIEEFLGCDWCSVFISFPCRDQEKR